MLKAMPTKTSSLPFRIVAIGDSVIEGKAADPHCGWVDLFSSQLYAEPTLVQLINRGRGGCTVSLLRARLYQDCIAHDPDLVVVGVGVNDSRHRPSRSGPETPIGQFRYELEQILSTLKEKTSADILVPGQVPVIDRLVNP